MTTNKEQKNELVIALATSLVINIVTNPAFSFAKAEDVWEVLATYADLRDAGFNHSAAYSEVMNLTFVLPEAAPIPTAMSVPAERLATVEDLIAAVEKDEDDNV